MSEEAGLVNQHQPITDVVATAPPTATSPTIRTGPRLVERLVLLLRARADLLVAGSLGLLVFLNYLWTLAPTVLGEDAGRWQARVYVLGTGHPTGYPTYIMLGKLFTYLPVGDVAYRVNLASALYGTAAVVLLYFVCRRFTGIIPAVLASLAFAISRTFWSQAVVAEVYTLHALFLCAALLALLVWKDTREDRYVLLTAFLVGLAMTNHMTSGLLVPCAALLVWLTDWRKLKDWRLIGQAALLLLLGLTPYLYLPVRASMHPPMVYGNPDNLSGFLDVVSGGPYKSAMWTFGLSELPARGAMYWVDLRRQFSVLLLTLSVAGFVWSVRRGRSTAPSIVLVALFAASLIYALEYDIFDIFVYFIPTHLIIAIFLACGIQWLIEISVPHVQGVRRQAVLQGVIPVVLLLLIGYGWQARYDEVDQSDNYSSRMQMEAIASAPAGSVIYDHRSTGVTRYLQYVEGRADHLQIRQVDRSSIRRYLEADLSAGHEVYFLSKHLGYMLRPDYVLYPKSGLFKVLPNEPVELLTANADLAAASEYLKTNQDEGTVVASPYVDLALQRMGSRHKLLPAYTESQLEDPEEIPAELRQQAEDVRWLYSHAAGERTYKILDRYDVSHMVLMKRYPRDLPKTTRIESRVGSGRFRSQPQTYRVAFENESVIVFEVLR